MKEKYLIPNQPRTDNFDDFDDSTTNQASHLSKTNGARILADLEPDLDESAASNRPPLPEDAISETPADLPPLERFRVNPADYPIFCQQASLDPLWSVNASYRWNIDRTLSTFVTDTAELIATIDGSSTEYELKPDLPKPDFLIYLDKSARPVSWLVNTFWNDFSKEKRPPHTYLNIDRIDWFHNAGVDVDAEGEVERMDGHKDQARGYDFDPDKLPPETFAQIRALFLPDGIESEDPETIMSTPSNLEDKNILIIDEVGKSGSTLAIAQKLLERAIPEIGSVRGAYFWHPGHKTNQEGTKDQILSVPVWYDAKVPTGRGVGNVDENYYRDRYDLIPNNKTRAQLYGAKILSAPIDLDAEDRMIKFSSRELMREITKMHQDFVDGRILMGFPQNYSDEKFFDYLENSAHLRFTAPDDPAPDNFIKVFRAIGQREPEW